jgi:uncharacterized protein DUF6438
VKRALCYCLAAYITSSGAAGELFDLYYKSHSGTFPVSPKSRSGAEIDRVDSEIKEVGIERLGCLGRCPIYTLIVKNDGSFRYTGGAYVERKGKFTGRIRMWRWLLVVQYIRDMDYFSLDERYQVSSTDGDTVFTTVLRGDRRKTISNYSSAGPIRLAALQELIDGLLSNAEWDTPQ